MVRTTVLRLSTSQRRSIISSLFTATFFASIITVAASQILPCPAHKRRAYYAEVGSGSGSVSGSGAPSSSSSSSSSSPKSTEDAGMGAGVGEDAWLSSQTRRVSEKKPRRWIEEKMPE